MEPLTITALLWIAPLWTSVDACRHRRAAWQMAGHARWVWAGLPLAAELASMRVLGSAPLSSAGILAANVLVVAYLAKIRDHVRLASGMIRASTVPSQESPT